MRIICVWKWHIIIMPLISEYRFEICSNTHSSFLLSNCQYSRLIAISLICFLLSLTQLMNDWPLCLPAWEIGTNLTDIQQRRTHTQNGNITITLNPQRHHGQKGGFVLYCIECILLSYWLECEYGSLFQPIRHIVM